MNFKGQAALVVGASRGFGRGIVESLVASGITVTAVARNRKSLEDLAEDTSATIVVADATDQEAERILSETKPNLLVRSAGTMWTFGHCKSTRGRHFRDHGRLIQNSLFFGSRQRC